MTLALIGGGTLALAAIAMLVVGIDSALRHGGEGMLLGLGLAAAALVPAGIGAHMLGVPTLLVLTCSSWALATLIVLLALLSAFLMATGEQGGFVMLGVALAMGGALWAIGPGWLASLRDAPSVAATAVPDPATNIR